MGRVPAGEGVGRPLHLPTAPRTFPSHNHPNRPTALVAHDRRLVNHSVLTFRRLRVARFRRSLVTVGGMDLIAPASLGRLQYEDVVVQA